MDNTNKVTKLIIKEILDVYTNPNVCVTTFNDKIDTYANLELKSIPEINKLIDQINATSGTIFTYAFNSISDYIENNKC